jgi:hypothetical protein
MAMPYFCFSGEASVTRSIMLLRSATFCCQRVQYQPMPAIVRGTSTTARVWRPTSQNGRRVPLLMG